MPGNIGLLFSGLPFRIFVTGHVIATSAYALIFINVCSICYYRCVFACVLSTYFPLLKGVGVLKLTLDLKHACMVYVGCIL